MLASFRFVGPELIKMIEKMGPSILAKLVPPPMKGLYAAFQQTVAGISRVRFQADLAGVGKSWIFLLLVCLSEFSFSATIYQFLR